MQSLIISWLGYYLCDLQLFICKYFFAKALKREVYISSNGVYMLFIHFRRDIVTQWRHYKEALHTKGRDETCTVDGLSHFFVQHRSLPIYEMCSTFMSIWEWSHKNTQAVWYSTGCSEELYKYPLHSEMIRTLLDILYVLCKNGFRIQ